MKTKFHIPFISLCPSRKNRNLKKHLELLTIGLILCSLSACGPTITHTKSDLGHDVYTREAGQPKSTIRTLNKTAEEEQDPLDEPVKPAAAPEKKPAQDQTPTSDLKLQRHPLRLNRYLLMEKQS